MYFADFDYFERFVRPITGAHYRKVQHGPVANKATPELKEICKQGIAREVRIPNGPYEQRRIEVLKEAPSILTGEEAQTCAEVVQRWLNHSRNQIVAATHGVAPWIALREGELIGYELAYYLNTYGELAIEENEGMALSEEADAWA